MKQKFFINRAGAATIYQEDKEKVAHELPEPLRQGRGLTTAYVTADHIRT